MRVPAGQSLSTVKQSRTLRVGLGLPLLLAETPKYFMLSLLTFSSLSHLPPDFAVVATIIQAVCRPCAAGVISFDITTETSLRERLEPSRTLT